MINLYKSGGIMLRFTAICFIFLMPLALLEAKSESIIYHQIKKNRMVQSGSLSIKKEVLDGEKIKAVINYKVKGFLIPKKYRTGTLSQIIPKKYESEMGYLELEEIGIERGEKYSLRHLGREDVDGFENCHKVEIETEKNDWKAIVFFHPEISSMGWAKLIVTLSKFPNMPLHSNLKK